MPASSEPAPVLMVARVDGLCVQQHRANRSWPHLQFPNTCAPAPSQSNSPASRAARKLSGSGSQKASTLGPSPLLTFNLKVPCPHSIQTELESKSHCDTVYRVGCNTSPVVLSSLRSYASG
eukprot:599940-Rhodomonas_salina.1